MRIFFSLFLLTISLLANVARDNYVLNLGTFHNPKNANKIVAHFKHDKVNVHRLNGSITLTIDNLAPFERAYEKLLRARKIVPNPYLTEAKISLNTMMTPKPKKSIVRKMVINQNSYQMTGNYMIKLGSFSNTINVNKLISKFGSDHVDVEQVGNIYRLFISNIPNLGLAQEKLVEVKRVIPSAKIVINGYKQNRYQVPKADQMQQNINNTKVTQQYVQQQMPITEYRQQPVLQQQMVQEVKPVQYVEEPLIATEYIQQPIVQQQIPQSQEIQPIHDIRKLQQTVQPQSIPIAMSQQQMIESQEIQPMQDIRQLQQTVQTQSIPIAMSQQIVQTQYKKPQVTVPIIQNQIQPIVQIPQRAENINVTGINNYWGLANFAIANSTRIELLKHDLDILLSDYDIQMSEYYPTLALTYDHQYNHSGTLTQGVNNENEQGVQDADQNQGEFDRKHRDIANLTMNYELYRFGATDLRIKIARNRIDSLINDILVEKETLSQELLAFYVEILRAQTTIHYRGLILDKQRNILKVTKELQKAGVSSEDEVKDVEIAIKTLEDEIAQNYLLKQRAVGEIETLLDEKISLQGIDFSQLVPKNLPEVEFDFTPLGQRLLIEIETSNNELELMKKDYLATINTNGNYNLYDSFADNEQTNIQSNDWRVGLNVRWEFFSGFRTDNQVKRVEKQINRNYKSYDFERRSFEAQKIKRMSLSATRHNIIQAERNLIAKNKEKIKNLKVLKEADSANVADIEAAYILMLESEQNIQFQIIDQLNDDILRDLSNQNSYNE